VEGTFDVIISNPPYIATGDIAGCQPEVARHEPKQALDGGADGFSCYRAIVKALPEFLNKGGVACLEMGLGQQSGLETLAIQHGMQVKDAVCDLQGIARCLWITN
jgi:release factor glutamine methyltransferase